MLKIKTLKPKSNTKLIHFIHSHGVSENTVAQCCDISGSWLSEMLNHDKLDKRDVQTVKKIVIELSKKNRGNK